MDNLSLLQAHAEEIIAGKGRAIIAIDGMAASGKTTLSNALAARMPGSFVVHMDDFTVPFEDRYPGYYDSTLSNADIARFDREVLAPLEQGKAACFSPYVCHPEPGFLAPVTIPSSFRLVIVEGAYCLHPQLFDRYDLRVLHTVSEETQRLRIAARNGQAQLARFLSTWIPMENRHIQARRLHKTCDLILSAEESP